MSNIELINKLIYELKLHDSEVIELKVNDNQIEIEISCEGMNVSYYDSKLSNVIINITCIKTIKTKVEYYSNIIINDFSILKDLDKYIVKTDDDLIYIECNDVIVTSEEINNYKKLDDFLKSNN